MRSLGNEHFAGDERSLEKTPALNMKVHHNKANNQFQRIEAANLTSWL
jgi:hypothetical protein